MSKAYLNSLYEEGSRKEIFEWLCKLDKENDELRAKVARLEEEAEDAWLEAKEQAAVNDTYGC